jgi:hypothetical protein
LKTSIAAAQLDLEPAEFEALAARAACGRASRLIALE